MSTLLWAHLQGWLLLAALAVPPLQRLRGRSSVRYGMAPLLLAVTFLPLGGGVDLAGHLYAYSGPLSLTSLVLLAGFSGNRLWGREILGADERSSLLRAVAVAALMLYPAALGLGPIDPYALGYGGPWTMLLAGLPALLAWVRGRRRLAWLVLACVWAWLPGWGESANLWDFLLDGWLSLYAVVWAVAGLVAEFRRRI